MRPADIISMTLAFLAAMGVSGCVEKFDLGTLPREEDVLLDTSYVQFLPSFGGFTGPQDILVGNDQLLYVADSRADRVVMLDRSGRQLSARTMMNPLCVTQDTRLDLLVGGEFIASNGDTVGAIFRIHLVSGTPDSAHRLDLARIDTVWRETANRRRRFPGITAFGDNTYLALRTGPSNSSPVDPDTRVLLFDRHDVFITPLPGLNTSPGGTGITDIDSLTAITSFPGSKDFVLTQSSPQAQRGAIWMRYEKSADFEGWLPRFNPDLDPSALNVDFLRLNPYLQPEGITIDKARRDIFIADAGLDSVFKFNSRGRFKPESFGRTRSKGAMSRPTGLAFFEKVLFVLDGQSGEILRFRLSTDVPR